jgi:hypothetical protein
MSFFFNICFNRIHSIFQCTSRSPSVLFSSGLPNKFLYIASRILGTGTTNFILLDIMTLMIPTEVYKLWSPHYETFSVL